MNKDKNKIIKDEVWKEHINLKPNKIKLSQISLDPNNPRFYGLDRPKVEDRLISDEGIQQRCLEDLKKFGIIDLKNSIQSSGFWTIDRIVIRPLKKDDEYVVVEGNRRVAALKTIYSLYIKGLIKLPKEIIEEIKEFEVLIYGGKNPQIALLIQGFRHTPGIMEWEEYPKCVFLSNLEKEEKMSIQKIKSIFKREKVTDLIRDYHAIKQAKEDEDYGDEISPLEDFGYFDGIFLASNSIKEWAGWDSNLRKFKEEKNFKRLLRVIFTKEGKRQKPSISPTTRDGLAKLIQPEYKELFEKLEIGEINFDYCFDEIKEEEKAIEPVDISNSIKIFKKAKKLIEILPIAKLQISKTVEEKNQKKELLIIMEELIEILGQQIKNLKRK